MTTIFTLTNDDEPSDKINLDDLYEKRKEENLETIRTYNRILNKIHEKIKITSRKRNIEQICWFVVPEIIIGVPKFNNKECIQYLYNKLVENGFLVKYIHPNLLCISWNHYVPHYVRNEIKKKTGIKVDSQGREIIEHKDDDDDDVLDVKYNNPHHKNVTLDPIVSKSDKRKGSNRVHFANNKEKHNDTKNYKPTGKIVYDNSIMEKLESRFSK